MLVKINTKARTDTKNGFTLIEMMIVIAILTIAIGLAAPNLQSFLNQNKLTTSTNKLVNAINIARNEAIARRENVSVITSSRGWQISAVPLTTTTATVVLVYQLDDNILLDFDDNTITGVTFSPDGYRDLSGNTNSFNITVCNPDWDSNRIISVNSAGLTRVTKSTGGCP